MQTERDAARQGCVQLHTAGTEMAASAQTELYSAQSALDQLRAQAQVTHAELGTSRQAFAITEIECASLRLSLSTAEERVRNDGARKTKLKSFASDQTVKLMSEETQVWS